MNFLSYECSPLFIGLHMVRQTEAPTPSDVCADCCARKKRRRSLRFGYYDACDGCDC